MAVKKIVKTQKINKLKGKIEIEGIEGKSRQITENKQTFDLPGKIKIGRKTRQNVENKQTSDLTGKIEIE